MFSILVRFVNVFSGGEERGVVVGSNNTGITLSRNVSTSSLPHEIDRTRSPSNTSSSIGGRVSPLGAAREIDIDDLHNQLHGIERNSPARIIDDYVPPGGGGGENNRRESPPPIKNRTSTTSSISTTPPPIPTKYWSEPDANTFNVRGKNYKNDKKKIPAGNSVFNMIALDVVESHESLLSGICGLPNERVQLALQREANGGVAAPPFVVAINLSLPGPPFFSAVFYFAVDDMSLIDGSNTDNPAFSNLASRFFFGDSDEFRDKTFKLIPKIIDGNFIVRKAVGSTPAIIGKKLEQSYVRTSRYFELILDIGSSSVAKGVVGLALGYVRRGGSREK